MSWRTSAAQSASAYASGAVKPRTTAVSVESLVLWIGSGDGREALSIAMLNPGCQIVCVEQNSDLVSIARRVKASLSVENIRFEHADAMRLPSTVGFTHVFSTATAGDDFYEKLCAMLRPTQRVVLFDHMWRGDRPTIAPETASITLAGSGERRQLRAATLRGPAVRSAAEATDPVAVAVAATTPPAACGRGVKRRVRGGEEG